MGSVRSVVGTVLYWTSLLNSLTLSNTGSIWRARFHCAGVGVRFMSLASSMAFFFDSFGRSSSSSSEDDESSSSEDTMDAVSSTAASSSSPSMISSPRRSAWVFLRVMRRAGSISMARSSMVAAPSARVSAGFSMLSAGWGSETMPHARWAAFMASLNLVDSLVVYKASFLKTLNMAFNASGRSA